MIERSGAWRGPAQFAIGALVLTIVVMALTRPAAVCAMTSEPRRYMDVSRLVDREHLEADRRDADRVARRFAAQTPDDPGSVAADNACRAKLERQIVAAHTPAR
jgi:hypothetical protein